MACSHCPVPSNATHASSKSKATRNILNLVNYANGLCQHNSVHNCFNPAQSNDGLCKMCSIGQCP